VLETARDIGDRKRWEDRQDMLLNELKHRVKNILAVVQAVAGQTANETGAGKEFLTTFRGRVAALAGAQDLLAQSEWHGADLEQLVRAELKPYESKRADRVSARGESVMLAPGIATPLGLVIHELAVNAAKYGSLSVTQGDVGVSWTMQESGGKRLLTLIWRERNGPEVGKPAPKGGGGALIDRALPDAKITRELDPEGVVCTIRLPLPTGGERH
jgi:two-component system CheB/CheR fusion protein